MSKLSNRSQRSLAELPQYKIKMFALLTDMYSDTNPEGYINLSIAENRLSGDLIAQAISKIPRLPVEYLCYGHLAADATCAETLASFIGTHITRRPVTPNEVVVTCGASGAIDQLVFLLSDPGDSVIVVGPGYQGFATCSGTRCGVHVVSAQLDPLSEFRVDATALEDAFQDAGAGASRIRAVIVCSPGNPTGEVLDEETIRDIVNWARSHQLHCIFDEIYALSVHDETTRFVSVAEVFDGDLGDDVHIVWSMSKDFCASGLRTGVVVSQSAELRERLAKISMFGDVSRQTQWAVHHMLSDTEFIHRFLEENRRRLVSTYKRFTVQLENDGVPYLHASAGFFFVLDLRRWMYEDSKVAEMELWNKLVEARVLVTPCSEAFSLTFGLFRVCFGAVQVSALDEAWKRMRSVLLK